jgi:hypothetical protein
MTGPPITVSVEVDRARKRDERAERPSRAADRPADARWVPVDEWAGARQKALASRHCLACGKVGEAGPERQDLGVLHHAVADLDRAANRLVRVPRGGADMTTGRKGISASLISHVAEFHRNDGLWSTA